ncbi:ARPP-1 family domain-containing protein [Pseudonocardia alaniniphila]|uniref:ARG and Rhodanese-Phosphatase-superfamily-associated domain-containing protein n=1 Tax=Pseudonocardia alaniniphila TaxID=75291 RepID=A0ABS9TD81_9PSEU|nr:DUF6569 family protein [Pseudonocardia alaniniphila]MCH6166251.1 hypothetical protein [Pseudonocardia alaniniphila]
MELADVHVGNPVVRGALTVFPVFNGAAVEKRGYDLHAPWIEVAERAGAPVVGELVVTNGGARPALVLEGELLEGGWQHRVAARSVVVEPGASVVLEVRCVEHGRWNGGGEHVRTGRRAPVQVRAAVGQHEVWERVRRYGQSATESLLETTRSVDDAAAALVGDLRPLPFQSGVLIGISGWPVLLEVFDSPRTLAQVWDGMLHAAAVDAVRRPAIPTPGPRARQFAQQTRSVPLDANGRGATADARVSVLGWRGRAVQTVAINPRHELVTA